MIWTSESLRTLISIVLLWASLKPKPPRYRVVVQSSECINYCHPEADFIGEESASASKTADSSHDTAALRNDNLDKGSYCTTTVFRETLTADGRFVRLPAQVTGAAANLQARGCLALPRTATLSCDGQRATRNNKCPSRHLSSCRPGS